MVICWLIDGRWLILMVNWWLINGYSPINQCWLMVNQWMTSMDGDGMEPWNRAYAPNLCQAVRSLQAEVESESVDPFTGSASRPSITAHPNSELVPTMACPPWGWGLYQPRGPHSWHRLWRSWKALRIPPVGTKPQRRRHPSCVLKPNSNVGYRCHV